ncbi:MAG: hypothetical protein J0M17_14320 [Planctomycetes bacterium]|nr:hypothetical protein [Planctomycetota bacterium]
MEKLEIEQQSPAGGTRDVNEWLIPNNFPEPVFVQRFWQVRREKRERPTFVFLGDGVVETRIAVDRLGKPLDDLSQLAVLKAASRQSHVLEQPIRRRAERVAVAVLQRERQERP